MGCLQIALLILVCHSIFNSSLLWALYLKTILDIHIRGIELVFNSLFVCLNKRCPKGGSTCLKITDVFVVYASNIRRILIYMP